MVIVEGPCPTCRRHSRRPLGQNWCISCPEKKLPLEERERRANLALKKADSDFFTSLTDSKVEVHLNG
jgi:hypothetical protein